MPKPFLTYVQQIQKLKDKNLVIPDEPSAAAILHRYGYFALITGYKDLLKNRTTKRYLDGTTFDDIVTIYHFDEQLRELTFRYLLHIERHIRSSLWGDRIFEKCGIRRDEGGDGGKTLEIRGKRRLSARDRGANYQQS